MDAWSESKTNAGNAALLPAPQTPPALPAGDKDAQAAHPEHGGEGAIPTDLPRPNPLVLILAVLVLIGLLVALFFVGYIPHKKGIAEAKAVAVEGDANQVLVSVENPKTATANKDIILPCDVRANQQTLIYPRATGYLKVLHVDIQSHVAKDQLLAVIDAPDVDAQLEEDKANLNVARATVVNDEAALKLADVTLKRFLDAQKSDPNSVAQQDVDTKQAAYDQAVAALSQAKASVEAAQQEVNRLTVLQGFEKIYAPFAGTITARNFDIGALLDPANTGVGQQLFTLTQEDLLRVYVSVPQTYATQIKTGQDAFVKVNNYPTREFKGTVARYAGALDLSTRTMVFELDFQNPDGALVAGMYGQARLGVTNERPALVIPTSALVFNAEGSQVALVKDNKVHYQKISVGRDLGTALEVVSGLSLEDKVITNPSARMTEGSTVEIQAPPAPAAPPQTASAK